MQGGTAPSERASSSGDCRQWARNPTQIAQDLQLLSCAVSRKRSCSPTPTRTSLRVAAEPWHRIGRKPTNVDSYLFSNFPVAKSVRKCRDRNGSKMGVKFGNKLSVDWSGIGTWARRVVNVPPNDDGPPRWANRHVIQECLRREVAEGMEPMRGRAREQCHIIRAAWTGHRYAMGNLHYAVGIVSSTVGDCQR